MIKIIFMIFLWGLWSGCSFKETMPQICFRDVCVSVELAKTSREQTQGLQHREVLPKNHGMLFIFSDDQYRSFWMKDTLIPLDILWLDTDLRIVHIEHKVPPCHKDPCPVYTAPYKARYVLEINAGAAEDLGLKIGDQGRL